jgi:CAP12/Pycsar effector protein, TIR domain
MPNHRPLSKARLIAKKRETHRGFLISWPTNFDADVPISVIALRRVAVVVWSPDDFGGLISTAKKTQQRARQNVVFELGYFYGALRRRSGQVVV